MSLSNANMPHGTAYWELWFRRYLMLYVYIRQIFGKYSVFDIIIQRIPTEFICLNRIFQYSANRIPNITAYRNIRSAEYLDIRSTEFVRWPNIRLTKYQIHLYSSNLTSLVVGLYNSVLHRYRYLCTSCSSLEYIDARYRILLWEQCMFGTPPGCGCNIFLIWWTTTVECRVFVITHR